MEDYYTIQTPGHQSAMFAELHVLQKQGVMCDVILAAEDGEVMAHKVVLMAASKYFREKLSPVVGPTASKICLKGISVVELANLVKYIYTGKLLVAKETMDITLEISEILELNGVIQGYKEIISYEQLKDNPGGVGSLETTAQAEKRKGTSVEGSQGIQAARSCDQNTTNIGSADRQPDSSQSSKVLVSEQLEDGSTVFYQVNNAGDNVGKQSSVNGNQAVTTSAPHLTQLATSAADTQKMADEQAQHQDLLTVAIETLSDVPFIKNHPHHQVPHFQPQNPEVAKAVSSITGEPQSIKSDDDLTVEPFINGLTNTKTVVLSAGSVSNELGGKTDVYTVALDPSSIKSPIKMPRPKRMKTAKEKEAELLAKRYREKKNLLMQEILEPLGKESPGKSSPLESTNKKSDVQKDKRSRAPTAITKPDFQYESLSKTRKKSFTPKVVFVKRDSDDKIIKDEGSRADDFGQVVNFDSDDDVTEELLTVAKEAIESCPENKKPVIVKVKVTKRKPKKGADEKVQTVKPSSAVLSGQKKEQSKAEESKKDNEGGEKKNEKAAQDHSGKGLEKSDGEDSVQHSELSMTQQLDEIAAEKIKSSASKRKIRPPKKFQSDSEKGYDSGSERHESIPLVRTRRSSSRSLNLDKESTSENLEKCVNSEERLSELVDQDGSQSEEVGNDHTTHELINTDSSTSVASDKVTENEKVGGQRDKAGAVSKKYQPEIRLKKRTTEEMMEMAIYYSENGVKKNAKKGKVGHLEPANEKVNSEHDEGNEEEQTNETGAESDAEKAGGNKGNQDTDVNTKTNGKRKTEVQESGSVKKTKSDESSESYQQTSEAEGTVGASGKLRTEQAEATCSVMQIGLRWSPCDENFIDEAETLNWCTKSVTIEETDEFDPTQSQDSGKKQTGNTKAAEVENRAESHGSGEDSGESAPYVCPADNCNYMSSILTSVKRHISVCHNNNNLLFRRLDKLIKKKGFRIERTDSDDYICAQCGLAFMSSTILSKHMKMVHTEKKHKCDRCDYSTNFLDALEIHMTDVHKQKIKTTYTCKFCMFNSESIANVRKHMYALHGLIVVTAFNKKDFPHCKEGMIVTVNGEEFDPKTMNNMQGLTTRAKRKRTVTEVKKEKDVEDTEKEFSESVQETECIKRSKNKRTRFLYKLPVDEFLKEMVKRHEEFLKEPEKDYSFMSRSIAAATEQPAFPQASPQVRNTRANKIYNMQKLKPTLNMPVLQHGHVAGVSQTVNPHGGMVVNEVVVPHEYRAEVVVENVESDDPAVLTIREHRGPDGGEMIVINQNGKQTIVRSEDFYDTLKASGNDSSHTLNVISALLQAGEQIEIREQEEVVEIQNM